ncbi:MULTISPECIES: allantoinase AllB [unclassified Nocardioides]|uniref:allantoinase AllB n=1 Tax=Nocardioides sp. URHA0032 TaxID=1380388 RepID=UPI00048AAEAE|nr:allantoinase AllB [Nocardioides sp. URHA0032]
MAAELHTVVRARRAVVGGAERAAAIGIRDGRIAEVAAYDELSAPDTVVLADDEVLLPGLVDTHVHVNEPGRTEWEGFATATRAAAAGGVTTIVDMPLNSIPATTTVAALAVKQDVARDQVHVDVGFWGGAVPGNVGDLAALHEAGVYGFKCFLLDSGVAEFPPLDPSQLLAAMAETARLGTLMIVHAEDGALVREASGLPYEGFLTSRPPEAERSAVELVVSTARATGGRAHVVHLSAADALPSLRGSGVSVETCPHYLVLAAEDVPDGATEFKCCPPVRRASNRERLWAALATGEIDFVVSDHSPCTADLKRGDFGAAWGGIASLQLSLPLVWTAARERGHGLADVVGWMSTAPARRVELAGKGEIAVGYDADFCVLAPDEAFRVDASALQHKNPVSPYDGRTLTGTVRQTWLRGTPIDLAADPRGRLLRRGA